MTASYKPGEELTFGFLTLLETDAERVETTIGLTLSKNDTGSWDKQFDGLLSVGDLEFEMTFSSDPEATGFYASLRPGDVGELSLSTLLTRFVEDPNGVIPDVNVSLDNAFVSFTKPKTPPGQKAKGTLMVGVGVGADMSFGDSIPLVGPMLGGQTIEVDAPPTDSSHSTLSPPEVEKKDSTEAPVITEIATEPPGQGDDIHDVAESRTFLALVSSRGTSIHWLDLVEYEENMSSFTPPTAVSQSVESPYAAAGPPTPGDHGPPPNFYAAHAAAYAQQQHQSALKSHQQYFFQLQQQQQQQQSQQNPQRHVGASASQAPPPPPHGYPQWQQYSPMEMPTAGEAAAARRRGEDMGHPVGGAPMWPMYAYPHTMYPMMPPPPGSPGLMQLL